jgi:hypothetical protein
MKMSEGQKAPPIGTMILWYRGGDVNGDPIAAIVTGMNQHGHATLHSFQPMRAIPRVMDGVRHKDDPWFTENPKYAEKRDKVRRGRGVWSFSVSETAATPEETPPAKNPEPRQDGRRKK